MFLVQFPNNIDLDICTQNFFLTVLVLSTLLNRVYTLDFYCINKDYYFLLSTRQSSQFMQPWRIDRKGIVLIEGDTKSTWTNEH